MSVSGSCARAFETHEGWHEATRYLNVQHLKKHKKQAPRGPKRGRLMAAGRIDCRAITSSAPLRTTSVSTLC